jgi:hypothetical protein
VGLIEDNPRLLAAHIVFLPKLYDMKGSGHPLKMYPSDTRNYNASEVSHRVPNYT